MTNLSPQARAIMDAFDENGEKCIIIHPDAYHKLKEVTNNSFFGKIKYGWRLFMLSVSDWEDAMVSEDYVEEFFKYLGSCEDL